MSISAASIPFWLLTVSLTGLVLVTLFIRGDMILRAAIMVTAMAAIPWALGMAWLLGLHDHEEVMEVGRLASGPLAFAGPAFLFLLLAVSGCLERYHRLVAVCAVISAALCIITWRTELVVAGAWQSAWGVHLSRSGPLAVVLYGVILSNIVLGLVLGLRHARKSRSSLRAKRVSLVAGLVLFAVVERCLLGYGIGVYPFSVVPVEIAVVLAILTTLRADGVYARGLDRASLYELFILIAMVPLVIVLAWVATDLTTGTTLVAIVLIAPLFAGMQSLIYLLRNVLSRQKLIMSDEIKARIDDYATLSRTARNPEGLASALRTTIQQTTVLDQVALFVAHESDWLAAVGDYPVSRVTIDPALRDWLVAEHRPVLHGELATRRLGDVRPMVERMFDVLAVDVIVPVAALEGLVGAILAHSSRGLDIDETSVQVLDEVARSTANALTFLALLGEAEARMAVVKELEVAAAAEHARTPGPRQERHEICQILAHYKPAARFGGDWWMTHELPDGRVLVVIGDVAGRGMPAALVSSTVAGACQTAQKMLGVTCEVVTLLELLNDAVLAVGGEEYPMSCFAAVIDLDSKKVSFANAGHPFPYRVRRTTERTAADLQPLISRGTRLGSRDLVLRASTLDIEDGDILVFYSDALVDARNAQGRRYGDRRLQIVLQRFLHPAGERACEAILEDALAYSGPVPFNDDLTLVVVRLQRSPGPAAAVRGEPGGQ